MPNEEHVSIPMADGVRLSAKLFLPDGAGPWPAILEALPYRKDDLTASFRPEYVRFAEAGYVYCWLDVRGTGSSEGVATDEYPSSERTDLAAVIAWLASQDWSSGTVGMCGTSYSGFNSLQLAAERPPALKAIVSIFASDDRFGDDVHDFGGVLKAVDLVDYPAYMIAMNALPPVPSIFGGGWREEWDRRVEAAEPWVLTWLEHQRYDDYWRFGSVRESYGEIEAATMIVAGWADGYSNIALRSFPHLGCPKRVLIGPWPHAAVETCVPGPNIDLVPEMVRWWDRWLKDADNGVDREPPIVVYQQRSTPPDPLRSIVRGGWRFEPTWPPERLAPKAWALRDATPGGLTGATGPDVLHVRGDVGTTAWISCAGAMPWGQPGDQGPDEAMSLTYTWAPLDRELEMLGQSRLRARLTSDEPVAYLSAKVCDVAPDGSSNLVVRGLLNLAHRGSRSDPSPLEPGKSVDIELELEAVAWTFEVGHRIRLDLAGADWPNAWSPPATATLTIDREASELELPVLDGQPPVLDVPALPASEREQHDPRAQGPDGWSRWRIEHDVLGEERRAVAEYGYDSEPDGQIPGHSQTYGGTVGVSTVDPGRAWADGGARFEVRYPEATCEATSRLRVRSDRDAYHVEIDLVVTEDGRERGRRRWERTIPRDLQ